MPPVILGDFIRPTSQQVGSLSGIGDRDLSSCRSSAPFLKYMEIKTCKLFVDLYMHYEAFPSVASFIAACLLLAMASTTSFGLDDVLPSQIKDLKMGSSSSQVIDKIGSVGAYSKEVDPKDQRMKLTWQSCLTALITKS